VPRSGEEKRKERGPDASERELVRRFSAREGKKEKEEAGSDDGEEEGKKKSCVSSPPLR